MKINSQVLPIFGPPPAMYLIRIALTGSCVCEPTSVVYTNHNKEDYSN
jgi:hypothetical protein